MNNRQK